MPVLYQLNHLGSTLHQYTCSYPHVHGSSFCIFLWTEGVTALGVLCCFALFFCLTLLASSFHHHLSLTCTTCNWGTINFWEFNLISALAWRVHDQDITTCMTWHDMTSCLQNLNSLQHYMVERVLKSPNVQDEYHASSAVLGRYMYRGSSYFLGKLTACFGCVVLLCLKIVVYLTLLASFFLPSHLPLKHVYYHEHMSRRRRQGASNYVERHLHLRAFSAFRIRTVLDYGEYPVW